MLLRRKDSHPFNIAGGFFLADVLPMNIRALIRLAIFVFALNRDHFDGRWGRRFGRRFHTSDRIGAFAGDPGGSRNRQHLPHRL